MEQIGVELKRRREELGYTIEEISSLTSLSVTSIKKLENGNLEVFKEDLSYVPFYLKNYCKILNIDYDHVRNEFAHSMESYTEAIKIKDINEKKEVHQHVQQTLVKTSKKRDINYAFISLFAIIFIILGITVYSIFTILNKNTDQTNKKPVVVTNESAAEQTTPTEKKEQPKVETKKNEAEKPVITLDGNTNYTITIPKESEFEVDLHNASWLAFEINTLKVKQKALEAKVYNPKENPKLKVNPGDRFSIRVGALTDNYFKINNETIQFNSSLNKNNVYTFQFTFKGK